MVRAIGNPLLFPQRTNTVHKNTLLGSNLYISLSLLRPSYTRFLQHNDGAAENDDGWISRVEHTIYIYSQHTQHQMSFQCCHARRTFNQPNPTKGEPRKKNPSHLSWSTTIRRCRDALCCECVVLPASARCARRNVPRRLMGVKRLCRCVCVWWLPQRDAINNAPRARALRPSLFRLYIYIYIGNVSIRNWHAVGFFKWKIFLRSAIFVFDRRTVKYNYIIWLWLIRVEYV